MSWAAEYATLLRDEQAAKRDYHTARLKRDEQLVAYWTEQLERLRVTKLDMEARRHG